LKARPVAHYHLYNNEFNLHVNESLFSYERMGIKSRFEKEAKGNSELSSRCGPKHLNVFLLVLLPGSIAFELTLISTSIQLHAHGNVAAPCFRMNTYIPCPDWWNYLESNCVVDIIVTTENLKNRQSSVGNIIIILKTTLS